MPEIGHLSLLGTWLGAFVNCDIKRDFKDALEFSCGGVQRLGGVCGGRSASSVLEHVGSRHRVPSLLANMNSDEPT